MSEHLHLIIGGEHGTLRTFTFSRKRFLILSLLTLPLAVLLAVSFFTAGSNLHNKLLVNKVAVMRKELRETKNINHDFEKKIANLAKKNEERIANLKLKNDLLISNIQLENSRQVADLEMQNLKQQTSFKEERELLLSTAVNELNERNDLFESVMKSLGVKLKNKKNKSAQKNSGGPYIAIQDRKYDELIYKADIYLETLRTLPLGRPVPGAITSRYGSRIDPVNNKKAFHSGIDFRGKHGATIQATAAGKIIYAGKNGSFGNFVKIDHGNGYTTSFAHLQNYHVKKGDYVKRGQIIGLVGNSGRSTGPHLHYEIALKGKSVNPYKFIKF